MKWLAPRERQNYVSLFDDLFESFFENRYSSDNKTKLAAVDLEADEKNVYVNAEVAGINKKDIKIEYKDNILTIAGERKEEKEDIKKDYSYREITRGSFARRINVGDVDFEKAKANYKDGILKITLPKKEAEKSRNLPIE